MRTRRGLVVAIVAAMLASASLTGCTSAGCSQAALSVELNPATIAPGASAVVTVANAWSGCDVWGKAQARGVPVIVELVEPASYDVLATVTVPIAADGTGRGTLDVAADTPRGVYLLYVDHQYDRNLRVTGAP